ncbi:uncharacterized protein H6S33_006529 [Morchella sextelata]|uniref:uncharacterized protein n=1 Tax=Morchella sextelata TaxID=1174677 RepID=UPI001D03DEEE|nr:uncharacterized protein H6S33_006529 [Morchella sextelata]KAH0604861.1 hypothetical protein H6S33_006529 [Morchella sextelata]
MPDSTTKKGQFYSAKDPAGKVSTLDLGSFETPKDTAGFPKTPISGEINTKPPNLSRSRREAELLRRSAPRGEFDSPTPAVHGRRSARRLLFSDLQPTASSFPTTNQTATAIQQEQKGNEDYVTLSSEEQHAGQHVPNNEEDEAKPSSEF